MTYASPDWIGWLAGLIEGEGCVNIARETRQKGYRRGLHYRGYITLTNTSASLLERAADVIEAITERRPKVNSWLKPTDRWKRRHTIYLASHWEVRAVLSAVRPYLVSKAQQADSLASFMQRHMVPGVRRTDEVFLADELDYARCRVLNHRGHHGGPPIEDMELLLQDADQREGS